MEAFSMRFSDSMISTSRQTLTMSARFPPQVESRTPTSLSGSSM